MTNSTIAKTVALTVIENANENPEGTFWFKLKGTDYGTNEEFNGDYFCVYGLTHDDVIFDCDGCPTNSIAVRNALEESGK